MPPSFPRVDSSLADFIRFFTRDEVPAARVAERLTLALREPAAYQNQFADELAERGIKAPLPDQELRDLALLDALLAEDVAWEADWQDTAADMAEGLNEVLTRQGQVMRLRPNVLPKTGAAGPEQLDAVQAALEPLGLALVLFALDSDSFPLGVVAEAEAERLRGSARELGFGLTVY